MLIATRASSSMTSTLSDSAWRNRSRAASTRRTTIARENPQNGRRVVLRKPFDRDEQQRLPLVVGQPVKRRAQAILGDIGRWGRLVHRRVINPIEQGEHRQPHRALGEGGLVVEQTLETAFDEHVRARSRADQRHGVAPQTGQVLDDFGGSHGGRSLLSASRLI
ncbi:MAG: hypothetical protein WDO24_01590 [Pseudomonadota bacterium]